MKKIFPFSLAVLLGGAAMAQTVQDAKKLIHTEKYNSAATALHATIKTDPAQADAWYLLTQAYVQQSKIKNIYDSLQKAPASVQTEPLFLVAYGDVLLQQAKKDSAQLLFTDALKQTKEKDATVLAAVAQAHVTAAAGDAQYAIELANKAIKRDKRNAEWYILLGDAYRKAGNGSEAYKAYSEAINKDNHSAIGYYKMGQIFASQKNPDLYLEYYNKALAADASFAPAYYGLYNHYFYYDVAKAMDYFKKYAALADASESNDYAYTDLLYLTKQYNPAIEQANKLLAANNKEPRLYKLIAYSQLALKDTASGLTYMQHYFAQAPDSVHIMKDFEIMGEIYAASTDKQDSAAWFFEKAVTLEKDSTAKYAYYKKLSELYRQKADFSKQAKWLGAYYTGNAKATNIDLFNWGVAHYRAEEYQQADAVFGDYVQKHPEQGFGYYWQARSNALLDADMSKGLAVPHYLKVIEMAEADTTNETNRKWLVEAYKYIAAYKTNQEKDYATAVDYFEKLLEVEPDNADAKKYITILEKNIAATSAAADGK
jgi:tetratricopeptide (TPR) repeat protein